MILQYIWKFKLNECKKVHVLVYDFQNTNRFQILKFSKLSLTLSINVYLKGSLNELSFVQDNTAEWSITLHELCGVAINISNSLSGSNWVLSWISLRKVAYPCQFFLLELRIIWLSIQIRKSLAQREATIIATLR